ncbi:hypothetical protein ACFWJF_37025, partial [Streptomyces yangpuensis]
MIEELLAALADGTDDAGPRPGVGAEEIADILWLAARVDAAGPRAPAVTPGDLTGERPPDTDPAAPPAPAPGRARCCSARRPRSAQAGHRPA